MKQFFMLLFFSHILVADLLIVHNHSDEKPNPTTYEAIQKIKKVTKGTNLRITFKSIPWQRALLMIEKGLADGIINASYTEERAKFAIYPTKNGKLDRTKRLNDGKSYYIYKNKNSTLSWDGNKFQNVDGPIAAKNSYAVLDDLARHKNITIVTRPREELIISDLLRGEISAYAAMESETYAMKKIPNFFDRIIKEPIPIRDKEYYLIFSKVQYVKKKEEMEYLWNLLLEE